MSNNGTSGTGGVRNLRALFENKPTEDRSASPESRGRSPAFSEASINSRAVSKVRASFVVVERPEDIGEGQQWGLRKTSDVTRMADIKQEMTNGSMENGATLTSDSRSELNQMHNDAEPQSQQNTADEAAQGGLGNLLKGSEFEAPSPESTSKQRGNRKLKHHESPLSEKEFGEPSAMNGKNTSETQSKSIGSRIKDAVSSNHNQPPPRTKLNSNKDAKPIKPPPTRQVPFVKPPAKPSVSPRAPAKPSVSPRAPKTPTSPKIEKPMMRGSAAKPVAVSESAKNAKLSEQAKKPSTLSTGTRRVSSTTQSLLAPHQGPPSPRTSRLSKEAKPASSAAKPKSVPVLASVAAPTAASAARSGNPTNLGRKPTVTRRDGPQANTTNSTVAAVKKPTRTSLPAQINGTDTTKSRQSTTKKAPDEGFLARMMRPTASSAQKAHEKVAPSSPPQKKREPVAKVKSRRNLARSDEDKENSPAAEATPTEMTGHGKPRSQPLNDITPAVEPENVQVESNAETQSLTDIPTTVEPEEPNFDIKAESEPLRDSNPLVEPEDVEPEDVEPEDVEPEDVEPEDVAAASKIEPVEVSNV